MNTCLLSSVSMSSIAFIYFSRTVYHTLALGFESILSVLFVGNFIVEQKCTESFGCSEFRAGENNSGLSGRGQSIEHHCFFICVQNCSHVCFFLSFFFSCFYVWVVILIIQFVSISRKLKEQKQFNWTRWVFFTFFLQVNIKIR